MSEISSDSRSESMRGSLPDQFGPEYDSLIGLASLSQVVMIVAAEEKLVSMHHLSLVTIHMF